MKIPNKRDLFFFFERIAFSKSERKAVLFLCSLILLTEGYRYTKETFFSNSGAFNYEQLNDLISKKAERMQIAYDSILSVQYFPKTDDIKADTPSLISMSKKQVQKSETKVSENFLVNINSAGIKELSRLPRVGEKTAQAIIEMRNKIGGFTSVNDLLKVKGIGKKTLESFKEHIILSDSSNYYQK